MKRRLILCLAAALMVAAPARAASLADGIVAQLRAQGFTEVSVERTLLGRTRIFAEGVPGMREIILNPNTGEILRDLYTTADGGAALPEQILTDGKSGGSSGKGSGSDDIGNDGGSGSSGSDDGSGGSSGSDDSGSDDNSGNGGGGDDGGGSNSGSGGDDGGESSGKGGGGSDSSGKGSGGGGEDD